MLNPSDTDTKLHEISEAASAGIHEDDRLGQTVDFLLTAHRDAAAARRFFERAIGQHDMPEKITIAWLASGSI